MNLTPHQQSVITIALELEQMGHHSAAESLRFRHFPNIDWQSLLITHVPWEAVFKAHSEAAEKAERGTP